jgi:hypothetical protein
MAGRCLIPIELPWGNKQKKPRDAAFSFDADACAITA